MATVQVVAILKIKADKIQEAKPVLQKLVEQSRKQNGMIRYDLYEDVNEAHTYIVLEKYTNMEAFQKHVQTEHFKAARAAFSQLLSGPTDIRVLKPYL